MKESRGSASTPPGRGAGPRQGRATRSSARSSAPRAARVAARPAESPDGAAPPEPRVFIVDDHEAIVDGLRADLGQWVVGYHDENSPDLPARIRESGANVVIVDLLLKSVFPPLLSDFEGLEVIRTIRRECSAKIIAYSAWSPFPRLKTHALDSGADLFTEKEGPIRALKAHIRCLLGIPDDESPPTPGPSSPGPDAFFNVTGLELHRDRREVVLRDGPQASSPVRLDACSFALLSYLAEERAHRRDVLRLDIGGFRLTDGGAWRRLCEGARCSYAGQTLIPNQTMSSWANRINAKLGSRRPPHAPHLIDHGRHQRYYLNPRVAPENIALQ